MIHTEDITPAEVAVLGPGPDNTLADSVGAREAIECAAAGPGSVGPYRGNIKACCTLTC